MRASAYSVFISSAVLVVALVAREGVAAEGARYPLTYPVAEQFCPPVDGFFEEVQRTVDRVRGRTFRHQPNGGYGLPVVDRIGDANLLHLGADVGWYRVGDPVFAVANGVVRQSQDDNEVLRAAGVGKDSANETDSEAKQKAPSPRPSPKGRGRNALAWGNVVTIEHRLADGKYATTVYGHLASERLVKVGDVVRAGQQIGVIGTTQVNGGYKPHLHFGVRDGRMAEAGRKLVLMTLDGKGAALEIADVKEQDDVIVLKGNAALPPTLQMGLDGRRIDFTRSGENVEAPAELLAYLPSPEFMIVGYGLSTDGWTDPIAFLRARGADVNPAAFEPAKRRRGPAAASANRTD